MGSGSESSETWSLLLETRVTKRMQGARRGTSGLVSFIFAGLKMGMIHGCEERREEFEQRPLS